MTPFPIGYIIAGALVVAGVYLMTWALCKIAAMCDDREGTR